MAVAVRYLVCVKGMYYWLGSARLRQAGWATVRLPDDPEAARAAAEARNAQVDAWRNLALAARIERAVAARGVYVMQREDGPLKIGIARDPWRRLRSLQSAMPDKLRLLHFQAAPDARALERDVHRRLRPSRLAGEWFAVRLDVALSAIEQATKAGKV